VARATTMGARGGGEQMAGSQRRAGCQSSSRMGRNLDLINRICRQNRGGHGGQQWRRSPTGSSSQGRHGGERRARSGEPSPRRAQQAWILGGGGDSATWGRLGQVYSSLINDNIKPAIIINLIYHGSDSTIIN
jgi:hypothetical protein